MRQDTVVVRLSLFRVYAWCMCCPSWCRLLQACLSLWSLRFARRILLRRALCSVRARRAPINKKKLRRPLRSSGECLHDSPPALRLCRR